MLKTAITLAIALLIANEVHGQDSVDPTGVLQRWVGTWKTEVIHKPAEWTPNETKIAGQITCKPILDGKFVEETGRSLSEDTDHRVIWGYDPRKESFRTWFFDSRGTAMDWEGKWNEKTHTMIWEKDTPDGLKSHAEHHFIDADHYEWKSIVKDADGKVYLDIGGKHTRVKDSVGGKSQKR